MNETLHAYYGWVLPDLFEVQQQYKIANKGWGDVCLGAAALPMRWDL